MTHYTSFEGAHGILKSGVIFPSTDSANDAFYGTGTYFTAKNASAGRNEILRNNYDGTGPSYELFERTEVGIVLKRSELPNVRKVSGGERDIWVHPGPVILEGKTIEVKRVTKK